MFIAEGIMPTLYQAAPTSSICGPHIVSGLSELRFCLRQLGGRSGLPGEDTYSCLLGRTQSLVLNTISPRLSTLALTARQNSAYREVTERVNIIKTLVRLWVLTLFDISVPWITQKLSDLSFRISVAPPASEDYLLFSVVPLGTSGPANPPRGAACLLD